MRNGVRMILFLIMVISLYAGIAFQAWAYPIGIISLSILGFLGTLKHAKTSNSPLTSKHTNTNTSILGASVTLDTSNEPSSNFDSTSSGSDAGC